MKMIVGSTWNAKMNPVLFVDAPSWPKTNVAPSVV